MQRNRKLSTLAERRTNQSELFDSLLSDQTAIQNEFRAQFPELAKAAEDAFLDITQLRAFREFREERRKRK